MEKAPSFKQEITAVFGKPVAENPTQVMVEAAYRHLGLAWRYLTLEVDPADLGDAVRGAKALGFAGFNCTIPHKVAMPQNAPLVKGGKLIALIITTNAVITSPARQISIMPYSPVQLGLRFCENASGPSTASLDLNNRAWPS